MELVKPRARRDIAALGLGGYPLPLVSRKEIRWI